MTVTLYTKPQCVQCVATSKALTAKGIQFEVVDISKDQESFQKVQSMGYRQVPVVCVNDEHWSGFRPDLIAKI